ncbi:ribonuclease H-like domain-containing protein [Tanacetum coccineum]
MIRCRSEVEEAVRMISSTYSSKPLSRNCKAKNSPYGSRFDNKAKCLIAVDAFSLVANGRSQQQGIDCDWDITPVVKPATIRTVLSLAVSRQWPIHQLDVKNAFLHDHLKETVYMHQPPGFTDSAHSDYGPDTAYLLLYVDDIILTASSTSLLQRIISLLHAEFAMTDLGPLNYFLGISATRTTSGIFLSQTKYATEILEQAQMLNCNPCRTPIDTEKKLGPEGSPVTDPTLYRSLAGSLQYLTFTRPDLSYAVQQLCLYMHDPREPHLNAMKRVLCYLRGTTDLGLQLFQSTTYRLIALLLMLTLEDTLSRFSAEVEYRKVANAVAETSWIRNLLRELHTPLFTTTLVYCDNLDDAKNKNALHMVAKLAPFHRLNVATGAALQMQRELQWFQEVEKIIEPSYKEVLNTQGKTSRMVFTESHAELLEKGQQWMKDTASSCTVVDALVVIMAFAVAFTVPGGNQDNGKPLFLDDGSFMLFIKLLAAAGNEAEWLRNLIYEIPLWPKPISTISIRCDSAATLAKAYSQVYNGKSRHLGVRHSMIRELIMNGVISVEFISIEPSKYFDLKVFTRLSDFRDHKFITEADFLYALPKRLTIGLLSLFMSLAVTLIAFSAALALLLRDIVTWIAAPLVIATSIPVSLFGLLQFPLLIDYYLSYSIFKRIIAQEALNHEWFREVPLPRSKDFLPIVPAHHAQDRQDNDESPSLREATSQGIAT